MRASVLLLAAIHLSGCDSLSNTVNDRYATLAEARADDLFGRGWLPDVLPESAVDIRTSNNLDLNYSVGEFSFAPADAPKLLAHLSVGAPPASPFASWTQTVANYKQGGYSAWSYGGGNDGTWVFFCQERKGRCDYFFWLRCALCAA